MLIINNNDVYLHGTTEQYPSMYDSDQEVVPNSAHWYRECSNKGLCDRSTGTCTCFEGYEGSGCQRASCPVSNGNVCSGHGVCKDIKALANDDNYNIYNLWDEHVTLGCACDAGFTGPDCSMKQCATGVDPLYVDGFANTRYSNWTIQFFTRNQAEYVYGNYSIIFYDEKGEDWQTVPIDINANCMAITEALEGIPNGVINAGSVRCQKSELPLHNSLSQGSGDGTYVDSNSGQLGATVESIFDGSIFIVTKFIIAFPMNPGYLKPPKINRYLDGSRPTLYTKQLPSTLAWHIFPNGFTGENTDYVQDECLGVLASVAWDGVSATHHLTGMDAATMTRLKNCLGDSNGVDSDNINTYNWDYGNWMNPHLIKLVEATQDTITQYVRPDGSSYKVNDVFANNDGSVQDTQPIDFPVSKLCTNGRVWVTRKGAGNYNLPVTTTGTETVIGQTQTTLLNGDIWGVNGAAGFYNIGQQGYCMNLNPPGFYAVIYFDDCSAQPTMNSRGYTSVVPGVSTAGSTQATAFCSTTNPFRILNRAAADYGSNTKFHVFTTTGYLQQVNQNSGMFTTLNTYTASQAALSYHSNLVHFANVTENYKTPNPSVGPITAITQTFVGQVDCETTVPGQNGALDCLEKDSMVMFLNLGVKDPVSSATISNPVVGAALPSELVTLYDISPINSANLVGYKPADSNVAGLTQGKCFSGTNAQGVSYGPFNTGTSANPLYTCPMSGAYQPTLRSLASNPVYPNIYTIKKISRNAKGFGSATDGPLGNELGTYDTEAMKESYRHTAILDFALNGKFTNYANYRLGQASDGTATPMTAATMYKFYPAKNAATYVGECSTRGICDRTTGSCGCFNGYTGQDCSQLNALAQ